MRILVDRSVEPRYVAALEQASWATVERCDAQFPQTAADRRLAAYAATNDMVVLTRDDDFFRLVREEYDCGLLFLHKSRETDPSAIRTAIGRIRDVYTEHSTIEEGLPGEWI